MIINKLCRALLLVFCVKSFDILTYTAAVKLPYTLVFSADSSNLMMLYQQLFPATYTSQIYENMRKLIYVHGCESIGLNMALPSLMHHDCAVKFLYTNGQPMFQFCIVF